MAKNDSVFGFTDDDDDYSGVLDDGKSKPRAQAPAPAPTRRDMRARPESAAPLPAPLPAPKPASSGALPVPARPAPAARPEPVAPRREETLPTRAPQPQILPTPQRAPEPQRPAPAPTRPTLPPVRQEPEPTRAPAPAPARPEPTYAPEPAAYAPEPAAYAPEPSYTPEPERQYQPPAPQQYAQQQYAQQQYDPRVEQPQYAPTPQRPLYSDDTDQTNGKGKGKKGKKAPKGKNAETRRGRASGGRKQVLIVRYSVMGGVLLMALLGVKSIVFPASLPSPDQVVARVQEGLGVTNFPADQGEGFVLSFADTYLNYTTETASIRNTALQNYTDLTEVTSGGLSFTSGTTHEITQGPYVSGVRYTDDQNAVYTVSAQINNDAWLYLAVPVFYDPAGRSFVVSSVPSLVPAPSLAQAPIVIESQQVDEEASKSANSAVNAFMEAWAASDQERLDVVVDSQADARARHGLGAAVELGAVDKIEVFASSDEEESSGSSGAVREAKVAVTWKVPNAPVDPSTTDGETVAPNAEEEFTATYSATYRMLLVYQGDGKWLVRDILPYGTSMENSKPAGTSTPAPAENGS